MSSSKEFKDFILDQLTNLNTISCRPMMGEYLLYYNGILFGGIYDDRLLIKKTKSNKKFNLTEEMPYKNAKPMLLVEDFENTENVYNLIKLTCLDLKNKKKVD